MKKSTIFWTLFWVILVGGVSFAIYYDETVLGPERAAEWEAKPAMEKYEPKVLCLNGVEYWRITGGYLASMAPKYSPGKATPDTCDEENPMAQ